MFVCLFVLGVDLIHARLRNPPHHHHHQKTDWCRALQLTPRAPSINQLPELGVEEMMFVKLAPSAACVVRGGEGLIFKITAPLICDIQKTRRNKFQEITFIL